MGRRIGTIIMASSLVIFLFSCSFAPEDAMGNGRPSAFPDMRLEQTRYLLGMDGMQPIHIDAHIIELYHDADEAYITDATFTQHDQDGDLRFSGNFGSAIVDTVTNALFMEQGVSITNHLDNFSIEAEGLHWDHQNRKAWGESDTMVTITMKEHDILRGTGFQGDFSKATFEFDHIEEGRIHYD